MAVDLPGDDRSLNTRQKLLRFRQGQTQVGDIAKIFRPTDFYQIGAWAARVIPGRNQPQHPSHPRSPSRLPTGRSYPHVVIPPFSGTPRRHPPPFGRSHSDGASLHAPRYPCTNENSQRCPMGLVRVALYLSRCVPVTLRMKCWMHATYIGDKSVAIQRATPTAR